MVTAFWSRLKHDYRFAPLWQKLFLVLLLSLIFFFLVLRPLFLVSLQEIRILENERNRIDSLIQANKILIHDVSAINKNAQLVQENLRHKVLTLPQLKDTLTKTLRRHTVLVFQCDILDAQKLDYGMLAAVPVNIKVNVPTSRVDLLLRDVLSIGFGQIRSVEYAGQVLTMDLLYVYTKTPVAVRTVQQRNGKRQAVFVPRTPQLQGFISSGTRVGVICNNQVYYSGDRCGEYVIVSIQPTARYVVFDYRGKKITVRK